MGLLGNGGFDGREERKRREAAIPLCADCPRADVREALREARESDNPIMREAGSLAKKLLLIAGCEQPQEGPDFADEFAPGQDDRPKVCDNPNIEQALTIVRHAGLGLERAAK